MNSFVKVAGVLIVVELSAFPAQAESPHLSGSYLIDYTGLCPIVLAHEPGTNNISVALFGGVSQTTGVMTFTPTVAYGQSGKVAAQVTQTDGSALRSVRTDTWTTDSGERIKKTAVNMSGTYTMTASTITLSLTGQPAFAVRAYYGKLNSTTGRAGQVNFLRFAAGTPEGQKPVEEDCTTVGTMDAK
jgi:hypothetical protein